MINTQKEFVDILTKAYQLTREALTLAQTGEVNKLNRTLDNRERVFSIAETLSERLALHFKTNPNKDLINEFNVHTARIIDQINQIDSLITDVLENEKNKTQFEIAKTHKNKENFKGYNLNNLK